MKDVYKRTFIYIWLPVAHKFDKPGIEAAALKLFVAKGVDGVSVRDIADAVGMVPGNLYAHYRSKEDLVGQLFQAGYADYADSLRDAAATPGDFQRRLEAMIRRICALHDEDETRFRFLLMTQHGHLPNVSKDSRNPIELLCRTVDAAVDGGEIPPGDAGLIAAGIVGVVVQAATFRMYGRIKRGLGAMADEIVAACMAVAEARPAPRPKGKSR